VREGTQDLGFSVEQIAEQARGNAQVALLVLLGYARSHGHDLREAARFVGERFAPSWEGEQGRGADECARFAGLNVLSSGGAVAALRGDERRAEVMVTGWPDPEAVEAAGLNPGEGDIALDVYGPIAEYLGLRSTWYRQNETLVLIFERRDHP